MSWNALSRIFRGKPDPETKLLSITTTRTDERTFPGVENFLGSVAVPEAFSLEMAGDAHGVSLLARCRDGSFVRQQLSVHYRHARVNEVEPEDDPLRLAENEQAWSMTMGLRGPEYLPLRPFRDDDLLDAGSDPLISVIGALSGLEPGERLVTRLRLCSLGPDWSRHHQDKMHRKQQAEAAPSAQTTQHQTETRNAGQFIALALLALPLVQAYLWVQRGETWKAVLLGLGVATAMAAAGWAWWRIKKARSGSRLEDPLLIRDKLSRIAYQAQVEVVAVLPEHGTEKRAKELLRNVALAYQVYDNPAGARFKAGRPKPALPATEPLPPTASLFRGRNVLDVRELAGLWHPLGPADQLPTVARSGARVLYPSARAGDTGAHVGNTVGGKSRPVRFSADAMGQHHLYLARTRMGKSTLMEHIIAHKLAEKAAGRNPDAIVVIDPHADMVKRILTRVPDQIADQVYFIDLEDETRAPGINLVDARAFPNRDRTTDSVVRAAKGLWDQWGARMQSILEHVVKTLHEYNSHPDTREADQLTILDGARLLTNLRFRRHVLLRVRDPFIMDWWAHTYSDWTRTLRSDSIAPVQTRLAYYAASRKARSILGQPRTTLDLGKIIASGGVLLVSTAQGPEGRDVGALVGASFLNLVDSVIREQGRLPPEERRGALVVVDEMQAIPGVDYESMLSELGKFGASFILATQSMAKLADLSETMRDTVLANVGCLVVFQISGTEAQDIIDELDRNRLAVEDLVSLPSHHCYVRASVDGIREPTYYMELREPEEGDPAVARRIMAAAGAYTTPADELARLEARAARRVKEFRERLQREEREANSGENADNGSGKQSDNGDEPAGPEQQPDNKGGSAGPDQPPPSGETGKGKPKRSRSRPKPEPPAGSDHEAEAS